MDINAARANIGQRVRYDGCGYADTGEIASAPHGTVWVIFDSNHQKLPVGPARLTLLCDWETGTAASGASKCGRPARAIWSDETHDGDRPVCGIHARSAKSKFHGEVTPISASREG